MCSEISGVMSSLTEDELRSALVAGDKGSSLPWIQVLTTAETTGMTEVMSLLSSQIEGDDTDGLTPSELGASLERELRKLLCTNDKTYEGLRKEFKKTNKSAREIGISIATAIAGAWHLQVGLLTPFVLVFFMAILKIGVRAWCSGESVESSDPKI
jgi:hypothetical protein